MSPDLNTHLPQKPRRTWRQWSKRARVRIGFVLMLIVAISAFSSWWPRRNLIAVMWDGASPYMDDETNYQLSLLQRRLPSGWDQWVSPKALKLLCTDDRVVSVNRDYKKEVDPNWLSVLGKFRRLRHVMIPAALVGPELDRLRGSPVKGVDVISPTPESDLGELRWLTKIEDLSVVDASPTGGGWENLRVIPSLREVSINIAGSPESLHELCKRLGNVSQLESLLIGGSGMDPSAVHLRVTEADLQELARLTNLKKLFLIGNQIVTGDSLAPLSRMNSLQQLTIKTCTATDDEFQVLSSLSNLRSLTITGSHISEDGIARFNRVLPTCSVRLTSPSF